jgi:hypothetical protein
MKTATIFSIVLFPVASLAQNYPNINQGDMQQMMQQMQKMQACMENVDQTRLKTLEQQSHQFQKEMKFLCASGKRDAAQAKAIEFGREVATDPAMQTMRKCGEMMKGMMPKMPGMEETIRDYSSQHVCDSL